MTTIAYRDGIMAADSRAYAGSKHPIGTKAKIHRLADGSLFGASSSKVGQCDKLRRIVEERGVTATLDDDVPVQAIVVCPSGEIWYFNDNDSFSGPVDAEFIAIGSGEEYAHGAMMMGADAARAVEIAIACDPWTGGQVQMLNLHEIQRG